jgi:DNA-binding LytR/AlgR family response regulator
MDNTADLQQQSFEVKTPFGLKVICVKNILYVEAARKCSIVYLDGLNTLITYHLLKWYGKYLLKPCFFRCHNSYIVNCRFVDGYCNNTITLNDKNRIPLSRNRIMSFKEDLKYLLRELL